MNLRRHDSLVGHAAHCNGPTLWLCPLNRLEPSGSQPPSRRSSSHSACDPVLLRFVFVGRRRSLFSSHPTTFRSRFRFLAASYHSIARRESVPCLRQTSAAPLSVQPGRFRLRDAFGRPIPEKRVQFCIPNELSETFPCRIMEG
jgi:hypothetical protein